MCCRLRHVECSALFGSDRACKSSSHEALCHTRTLLSACHINRCSTTRTFYCRLCCLTHKRNQLAVRLDLRGTFFFQSTRLPRKKNTLDETISMKHLHILSVIRSSLSPVCEACDFKAQSQCTRFECSENVASFTSNQSSRQLSSFSRISFHTRALITRSYSPYSTHHAILYGR